jgi:hypothetical protein
MGESELIRRLGEEYKHVQVSFRQILRTSYCAIADFLGA